MKEKKTEGCRIEKGNGGMHNRKGERRDVGHRRGRRDAGQKGKRRDADYKRGTEGCITEKGDDGCRTEKTLSSVQASLSRRALAIATASLSSMYICESILLWFCSKIQIKSNDVV